MNNGNFRSLAQRIANRNEVSRRARWMPVCKHGHIDCSMTTIEGGDCFDETAGELEEIYGCDLNNIDLPDFNEEDVEAMLSQMSAE